MSPSLSLSFQHVTFAYDGATSSLFEDVTAHFSEGWTGIVGPNGAGKTTILLLAAGSLVARQGTIRRPGHMVFCPQRTDHAPGLLSRFIESVEAEACVLRGKLGIAEDWAKRWPTLSHGERKRAQIAVALWQNPDALLLDEPTNHIDLDAREMLFQTLVSFQGIGLLVSHDRALLDGLCRQCLFLEPPQALMRPGNYTEASAEAAREESGLLARRQVLEQDLAKLKRESKRRHTTASQADQRNSKRHLARGDSDGRAKIDQVRVSGKDGQAGRLAGQLKGRIGKLREQVSEIRISKRYTTRFWLEGSVAPGPRLFTLPAQTIALDESRELVIPDCSMLRDDRVAITGANGMGKSTFIRHVLRNLSVPKERLIYLPQEIDLAQTRDIMSGVHRLSREQLGTVMTVVSALGSRPGRLLKNIDASPGELRKVLLALGIIQRPYLIIMDEPTNHLDLPAIECLERALRDCPCGLLLVSHDLCFLARVANKRWHFRQTGIDVSLTMEGGFHD